MNQAIAVQRSVVGKLAETYGMEGPALEATLCETIFPNGKQATKAQVAALCIVADQYGLNPFTKQIYAFPAKGGGITPIIGVDGWYKILNEHPANDGFDVSVEFDEKGAPHSATVTFHRKDRHHPFVWTEYLDECYRNTDPWNKTKVRMLKHRAICQGARVCYGINAYEPDEAERIADFEVKETSRLPELPAARSLDALATRVALKAAEVKAEVVVQPERSQEVQEEAGRMAEEGPWAEPSAPEPVAAPKIEKTKAASKPKQADLVSNEPQGLDAIGF